MVGLLRDPFRLAYQGDDADKHTVDALYLGQSLVGTARLYNSVIRWHFHGIVAAKGPQQIKIHAGPPSDGSVFYAIYLMMVHGKLAVYPDFVYELAKLAIPETIKALIARRSGQDKIVEKSVDGLIELYRRHDEFAKQVHKDHVKEKKTMFRVIQNLAEMNRKPLADMSAPIGRSVRQIEHFKDTKEAIVVDEPVAEALRSPGGAQVGEEKKLTGRIVGVDTTTGSAKMLVEGDSKPTRAKITDPVLLVAENVYTHALDTQSLVSVTAKPVLKDGKISTLYISNAKPAR